MDVRLENPSWLWLAALAAPAAVIGLRALVAMSPARRWSAVVARAVLFGLIALALAGASSVREVSKVAVVALVDVSGSMRRYAPLTELPGAGQGPSELAREFLRRAADGRGADDLLGVVAFDGRALAAATPGRGATYERDTDVRLSEGTNIASAITLGLSLLPPDAAGRLLLISDGVATAGDALEAASAAATRGGGGRRGGVPIDVAPVEYDIRGEVVVESLDAPPRAAAGAAISLRAVLNATDPATGSLRLSGDGRELDLNGAAPGAELRVELEPGRNVFQLPVQLDARRIHKFRVVFEPDRPSAGEGAGDGEGEGEQAGAGSDRIEENNAAEAFTVTPGQGSVLVVDGVSAGDPQGAGRTLGRALEASGLQVRTVAPDALPPDLLSLQAYDLVVLQNVAAEAVPPATQEQLVAYVRDLGGGLLMTGGRESFGAGGWRGTPLEPVLPVLLELPERLVAPEAAIVFVIDCSGSMGRFVLGSSRSQQEIANQSVAAAIRTLDKTDLVGVIVFNRDAEVLVPLSPNTDPERAVERVLGVSPGGGTNVLPGLEEAGRQLEAAKAKTKHVIVLTDGRSMTPDALPPLAARLKEKGITVSAISVGDDADVQNMQDIADAGGGAFYNVVNPSVLPRVFLRAVRLVRSPLVREGEFVPVVLPSASPITSGLGDPPALGGVSLTQFRRSPTVVNVMATPEGEPLLAHWNVELGQVAAFTSDAHEWARGWVGWPGYGRFWTALTRVLSRAPAGRAFQATMDVSGDEVRVRVEATDDDGRPMDLLAMPAVVYGPDGEATELSLEQTAPGVYEGRAPATRPGTHVALVKPRRGETRLTPIVSGTVVASALEARSLRSDRASLEALAGATGGRVLDLRAPQEAGLFDRTGLAPTIAASPLWRWLLIGAVATLLLDIGTRRVAWDRWVSREFGAELGERAREAVRDRGEQAGRALAGLRGRVPAGPEAGSLARG